MNERYERACLRCLRFLELEAPDFWRPSSWMVYHSVPKHCSQDELAATVKLLHKILKWWYRMPPKH